jgi:hypothetical protein
MKQFILFLLIVTPCFGFGTEQEQNGYDQFGRYLQDKFSQFKNDPQVGYVRYNSPAVVASYQTSSGKTSYNINQFPAGDSRNYVKGQIMQQIGSLAQGLAQSAGTALAFQDATQLRQQATQLNASNDPQLQQMASQLNQEATAIESGNRDQATQIASQIASTPQPYVSPGYTPGPQESAFLQTIEAVLSGIAMSSIGILDSALASQLLSSLGINNQTAKNITASSATGLISGQPAASVGTNAAVQGTSAAGQAGQMQIQQIVVPNVKPVSNTSALPSAGN